MDLNLTLYKSFPCLNYIILLYIIQIYLLIKNNIITEEREPTSNYQVNLKNNTGTETRKHLSMYYPSILSSTSNTPI